MAPKLTDPNSFLTSIVTKKGKSDLYGVYLTGVNVAANATEEYGYEVSLEKIFSDINRTFQQDEADWDHLLVEKIGRAHV